MDWQKFFKNLARAARSARDTSDRRRRTRAPRTLRLVGFLLLFSPLINVLQVGLIYNLTWQDTIGSYDPYALILFVLAPLAGYGILQIRLWGYYIFMLYAMGSAIYNIVTVFISLDGFQIIAFAQFFIFCALIYYVWRPDIHNPFHSELERSFRRSSRKKILHSLVFLPDKNVAILDENRTGLGLNWHNCNLKAGDAVQYKFHQDADWKNAVIIHVSGDKVGLAYRKEI